MFDFIQNFIYNAALYFVIIGVLVSIFANFIPDVFVQYKVPAIILGIVLCLFGTFQLGKKSVHDQVALETVQAQIKTQETLVKSEQINTESVIKYQDKIQYVDRIKEIPVEVYVNKAKDEKCSIDSATAANIRLLLNSSHQGRLPGPTISAPVITRSAN